MRIMIQVTVAPEDQGKGDPTPQHLVDALRPYMPTADRIDWTRLFRGVQLEPELIAILPHDADKE